jgi:ubiquinol-cytochrome c reductase cytochrome c subunit
MLKNKNVRGKKNSDLLQVNPHAAASLALLMAATIALLVVCIPANAQTTAKNAPPESAKENVAKGKQLFTSSGCYQCHGREGQGSRYSGPRLGPPPISLDGFTEYIRAPKGQMPPYTRKVLSDVEVGDIYAFLKSIPQPPPAKSIPLLN